MNETTPILNRDKDTNKITPFLMFESRLGEALDFYMSIFKHSKVLNKVPDGQGGVMSATFELEGQRLLAEAIGHGAGERRSRGGMPRPGSGGGGRLGEGGGHGGQSRKEQKSGGGGFHDEKEKR